MFAWRRQARDREPQSVADVTALAAVVVGAVEEPRDASVTEIVIGTATVRVRSGVDVATLKAVLRALKASS